VLYQIRLVAI